MGLKTFTNLISCITIITIKPTSFTRAAVSYMRLPKRTNRIDNRFNTKPFTKRYVISRQDTLFSYEAMGIFMPKTSSSILTLRPKEWEYYKVKTEVDQFPKPDTNPLLTKPTTSCLLHWVLILY